MREKETNRRQKDDHRYKITKYHYLLVGEDSKCPTGGSNSKKIVAVFSIFVSIGTFKFPTKVTQF